jgi:transcription antitermination factor NusG
MSIVSAGKIPFPIPEEEIAAIQAALASGSAVKPCPYLKEGQRVRIEQGALEGVEGMLVREKSDWRVVLSIELLQRAVSVEVDRDWVTAL